ncbi:hypothetical protein M378DRAFT_17328 [Amanita muscaria Koide BX008]|uniref:CCHC-type domain-containing protein n=1 Tax=Amanita muscaria (strain Koide BX008) TaxID=946122 RepID=A0A0C2SQ58_AMAMK|nr:hypothetical protein M378DRAFT_17328 [Amanita muscaria Koide BX008]
MDKLYQKKSFGFPKLKIDYQTNQVNRWKQISGDHLLPDWFFEGNYAPGTLEEHLPEELLRTEPTVVAGPSNPEPAQTRPSFSANVESSSEESEGESGTSEEFVDTDQSAELEYTGEEQQEQNQEEEEDQENQESSSSSSDEDQPETGTQTVTHVTPLPPLQINLPPLPQEPPPPPSPDPSSPDIEMSTAPPPTNNTGLPIKLPFPDPFTGKRHESTGFLQSCISYMVFYAEQFNNDAKKTVFILLLCKGNASTWSDTKMKKLNSDTPGTWAEFQIRFNDQWEEVNSAGAVMNAIKRLKLSHKFGMDKLTARFDELVPYCGLGGNDFMMIELFCNTLPTKIRKHVFLQNPKTYDNTRKAAVQYGIANDRIDIAEGRKPKYGVTGFHQSLSSQRDPYAMDVDAIDLEEEGTNIRFTKLSPSQMEEYKSQGKCFNCRQRGHMSRNCPNRRNNGYKGKRPQKGNGNWRKGKPSRSIRSVETDNEPAEEDKEEGSSKGGDITRIRAMIANLDADERSELFGKDFQ